VKPWSEAFGGSPVPQSLACVHIHFVFSTKGRQDWINPEVAEQLHRYFGGLVRTLGSELIRAGGMPDHVHLLISLGRGVSLSEAMRVLKANSSGWIHDTFPELSQFAWQSGYGAFAVSASKVGEVIDYIANQQEHHRGFTFQQEFRLMLQKHGIEWDERYVWD
jgi:putative transposase